MTCIKCKQDKSETNFRLMVKFTGRRNAVCYECELKLNRSRYLDKKLKKFGLTIEEVNELIRKGCIICGRFNAINLEELKLDHCHKTGKFRGVLCHNCNAGLGHFKDNPNLLLKAASYLEERKYALI